MDHLVPFQCRAWLTSEPPLLAWPPTVQHLLAELQRTPSSWFSVRLAVPAGLGVAVRDHFLPFQCRASFRMTPVPPLRLP